MSQGSTRMAAGTGLLAAAMGAWSGEPLPGPAQAAEAFYAAYRGMQFTGLPDAARQQRLAAHLSPRLQRALAAARAEQQRCARRFPDDKPPWIEGDLFSSSFEGFTEVAAGEVTAPAPARREVVMTFRYREQGQASAGPATVQWQDRALMVRHAGRWVLDDVRYQAGFAFGNGFGARLRQSLAERPAC